MALDPIATVISRFESLLEIPENMINEIGTKIPLPTISENLIKDLCDLTLTVFKSKKTLVEVEAPIYIVGDIHGNIFDLLRILIYAKTPPTSRLLFLGDYVDRGQYSVEVISLLFALQCAYPDNITLLRGNHEFAHVNQAYGFYEEVLRQFGSPCVWKIVNNVFKYMPLAAIVSHSIFCVHGGLSPTLTDPHILEQFERPIETYENDLIGDILWSDPSLEIRTFKQSSRGIGYLYGEDSTESFLKETGMEAIIRGHECVMGGIQYLFNKKVVTVFSASDYCGITGNSSGVLEIDQSGTFVPHISPPIPYLYKRNVKFIQIKRKIVSVSSSPTFDPQHTSRALPQLNDSPLKNQKTVILSKDRPHIKIMKLNGRNTSTKIRNNPSKRQIPKSNSFNEGLNHLSKK